jgi:hypothetical protein
MFENKDQLCVLPVMMVTGVDTTGAAVVVVVGAPLPLKDRSLVSKTFSARRQLLQLAESPEWAGSGRAFAELFKMTL